MFNPTLLPWALVFLLSLALLHSRHTQAGLQVALEISKVDNLVLANNCQACSIRLVDKVREQQDLQGRNITFDNLYTSIPLAKKLLERKITVVGTMRHNRKGVPKEIKSIEGKSRGWVMVMEPKEAFCMYVKVLSNS